MVIKKLSLITLLSVSTAFADWQVADPVSPTFTAPTGTLCSNNVIYSNAGIDYHGVLINGFTAPFQCEEIIPPPPLPGSVFGLEWPGDAHLTNIRRMLLWSNPPPAFPMTYIFKVFPRKKTNNHAYFTTFFWGTNGPFSCNWNYYGAHPYPVPAPSGPGRWESGSDCSDETAPGEVEWNRWFQQAVTAEQSGTHLLVSFYYDLPNTAKLVQNNGYLRSPPPNPAIVMGQSPDDGTGKSWGGYDGWEEFNGVIRGIQIYNCKLSLTDIQAEISQPLSTTQGQACIWYLNLNPRPTDVTDKKGIGTPNNPQWEGTTALEWSE